jgi:hypothetical protein
MTDLEKNVKYIEVPIKQMNDNRKVHVMLLHSENASFFLLFFTKIFLQPLEAGHNQANHYNWIDTLH